MSLRWTQPSKLTTSSASLFTTDTNSNNQAFDDDSDRDNRRVDSVNIINETAASLRCRLLGGPKAYTTTIHRGLHHRKAHVVWYDEPPSSRPTECAPNVLRRSPPSWLGGRPSSPSKGMPKLIRHYREPFRIGPSDILLLPDHQGSSSLQGLQWLDAEDHQGSSSPAGFTCNHHHEQLIYEHCGTEPTRQRSSGPSPS